MNRFQHTWIMAIVITVVMITGPARSHESAKTTDAVPMEKDFIEKALDFPASINFRNVSLEDAFDHARATMGNFSASSIDIILSSADAFPSMKIQVRPVKPKSRELPMSAKNSPKSRQVQKSGIGASMRKQINKATPADFDTRSPAWEKRLAYDSLMDGNCRIIMRNQSLKRMLSQTRPGDDHLLTHRMITEASTTEAFHPLEGVSLSTGNDSGIQKGSQSKIPRGSKHGTRGGIETWKSTVERFFEGRDIALSEQYVSDKAVWSTT